METEWNEGSKYQQNAYHVNETKKFLDDPYPIQGETQLTKTQMQALLFVQPFKRALGRDPVS